MTERRVNVHKRSLQSANTLFKFMNNVKWLKEILEFKTIMPRYCEEDGEYLSNIDGYKIAFPMVCFCDIKLKDLKHHMKTYGRVGIGLKKEWGISNGVQPLHYINDQSYFNEAIKNIFKKAMDDNNVESEMYRDYLLEQIKFSKPIQGKMKRNGCYDEYNFHDEHEWRYVPNETGIEELDLILADKEHLVDKYYYECSETLKKNKDIGLKFEYSDIKYLIVTNKRNKENLVKFILKLSIKREEKNDLISKIINYRDVEEDW